MAIEETEFMKRIFRAVVMALLLAPGMLWADDYDDGLDAYIARDYETAYELWLPFAAQGDAKAQVGVALMYSLGQGVAQDYAEAARWYRAAAEQGNALAQSNLGLKYANGEGVIQDYSTAHMWFNIVARDGYSDAVKNRDAIADRMTPEAIAESQRRARICLESDYQDCD